MEGLTKRAFIFGGLLIIAGSAFTFMPKVQHLNRTEKWMESIAPAKVGTYDYIRSPENIGCSYKMNEFTYEELHPYGIVPRIYQSGDKSFDVVLIASRSKESFHDPRVCFRAQQWTIEDEKQDSLESPDRGTIPLTIVRMSNGGEAGRMAAFFYRGPSRFYATTDQLRRGLFIEQLKMKQDIDGVFYRFIPLYQGATVEDLKQFIIEYLHAAKQSSGAYF